MSPPRTAPLASPRGTSSGTVPDRWGSYEAISFLAPTGSLITGGSLNFAASALMTSNVPYGTVYIENTHNKAFWECSGIAGANSRCPEATSLKANEHAIIPNQDSSELSLVAECGGPKNGEETCAESINPGTPVADTRLFSSDIQLSTSAVPVLNTVEEENAKEKVSGVTKFKVYASEPAGPGIYEIYVTVDGGSTKLESVAGSEVSPNCVNYGPGKGESWGFISTQPCSLTLSAAFTTDTTTLSNGAHTLYFTAVNGAGGTVTQAFPIIVNNPLPPSCVVPKVKAGATVKSVEHSLVAHHCGVGARVPKASRKVHKGRVISLGKHVGVHLPNGTVVTINVSSGRAHRHH